MALVNNHGCQAHGVGQDNVCTATKLHKYCQLEGLALANKADAAPQGEHCFVRLNGADNKDRSQPVDRGRSMNGMECEAEKVTDDSVGQEFLRWKPEQALQNIASAVDGLQRMLDFLDQLVCKETRAWEVDRQGEPGLKGLGAGLQMLSQRSTQSCERKSVDHHASIGKSAMTAEDSLEHRRELWPWVTYSRQELAAAKSALLSERIA
jgi:hypothetical protein